MLPAFAGGASFVSGALQSCFPESDSATHASLSSAFAKESARWSKYPGVRVHKRLRGEGQVDPCDTIDMMNAELTAVEEELQAKIAVLERQVALWKGPVKIPTLTDCWRKFRTQGVATFTHFLRESAGSQLSSGL
eukprot:COSAG02_NODE_1255_length_13582_cov_43.693095_11_plen_135_part_00